MKSKLLAGLVLAGGSLFAGPRIAVGVGFGTPAPVYTAPAYVAPAYVPPCPGPDYVFVDGYWQRRPVVIHRDYYYRYRDFDRDRFVRHDEFRRDFHRR